MASPSPSSVPKQVGYDALRECHKKAYAFLTEALKIDEGGVGKDYVGVYVLQCKRTVKSQLSVDLLTNHTFRSFFFCLSLHLPLSCLPW